MPGLHVCPDPLQNFVPLQELRRVFALYGHRTGEELVGADVDVLLIVGVDERTGRDVTIDNVLDLRDCVEL